MRRFAKCYADKGEALPWCCVLLLRRTAVRWDAGLGGASLNGRRPNKKSRFDGVTGDMDVVEPGFLMIDF
jgi:hypothetical protein